MFIKMFFFLELLCYLLGPVNYLHWWFKSILSYNIPHTYLTFIGEVKESSMHLLFLQKAQLLFLLFTTTTTEMRLG